MSDWVMSLEVNGEVIVLSRKGNQVQVVAPDVAITKAWIEADMCKREITIFDKLFLDTR